MTYPVQPPEPPAIVYHLPSSNAAESVVGWEDNPATDPNEAVLQVSNVDEDRSAEIVPETPQIADEPLTVAEAP
ncbi:MAG TPA: hypothetical protein IGS17_13335, partial [Oscillatoriales cyanobacterium M59_W2019_021]|nr:hypothetical protein [Oscillatoriales cyanobacterium M4454_W2019_049]HIK51888.1 hypothetical protein [Oscillatoriales cyanobacterium M59_W2019_021]